MHLYSTPVVIGGILNIVRGFQFQLPPPVGAVFEVNPSPITTIPARGIYRLGWTQGGAFDISVHVDINLNSKPQLHRGDIKMAIMSLISIFGVTNRGGGGVVGHAVLTGA